jgi:hypothetical protein
MVFFPFPYSLLVSLRTSPSGGNNAGENGHDSHMLRKRCAVTSCSCEKVRNVSNHASGQAWFMQCMLELDLSEGLIRF